MPTELLYEGPDQGYYDWRFPLQINRWDSSRQLRRNETQGAHINYEAFLPKYNVTVKFEGEIQEHSKISLEGDQQAIQSFRQMVETEQSRLLEACGSCD